MCHMPILVSEFNFLNRAFNNYEFLFFLFANHLVCSFVSQNYEDIIKIFILKNKLL